MKKLVLGMVLSAVGVAMANTTYYLRNDHSESSTCYPSLSTPAAWNTKTDAKGVDATAIDSTGDFVVELWRWLRIQGAVAGVSFAGNSLTIARGYLYWYDACNAFSSDGTVICQTGGFIVNRKSNNSRTAVNADFKFEAPVDLPFGICPGSNSNVINSWVNFNGAFSSDAGVTVHAGYGRSSCSTTASGFLIGLNGDYSGFQGTLCVTSACTNASYPGYGCALALRGGGTLPGVIEVASNCVLTTTHYCNAANPSGPVKVGGLRLSAGSSLFVPGSNNCFEVAETLEVAGPVRIRLTSAVTEAGRVAVLKAPAAGILRLSDFSLDFGATTAFNANNAWLSLSDGGKSLDIVFNADVTMVTTDNTDMTKSGQTSALTEGHGSQWSDGLDPHDAAIYSFSYQQALRTPENVDYVFPGSLLNVKIGSNLILCGPSLTADVAFNGTWGNLLAENRSNARYVLKGTLRLPAGGTFTVRAMNNGTIQIDSSISGGGNLKVSGKGDTSAPSATTTLTGSNTAWLGKMSVTQESGTSSGKAFPSLERFQALRIDKAEALGGRLDAFTFDALTLQDYSKLHVTNSVTLPADSNRGLLVSGIAQVGAAADAALTVNWPVTFGGSLHKNGGGRLTLGGKARFLVGGQSAEMPTDAVTNQLLLTDGSLKVADCDALNGVRIYIGSASTPLVLDFNPADADLKRYGIRNVKTDVPFTAGRKIYLQLEGVDDAVIAAARKTDAGFKQGLVTVKTSALDTFDVKANLVFMKPEKTRLIREDDAATGWTTFSLYGRDSGFSVIVR